MPENIFLQISMLLGLTVSIAFIVRLLRQPLIVAYIVAGLIAGPLFLNVIKGGENFYHAFAQFGIILLLFVIGLSLNFSYIKLTGKKVLFGALLQFIITAVSGFFILYLLNLGVFSSLFIGIAVAFSSTIIVVKLLTEKNDLETVYGKYVVGILLVQDIIAICIMLFLNTPDGQNNLSWYFVLLLFVSKAIVLLAFVFLMSKYVLPLIMNNVAHSNELMFIFTIAWCFGVASIVSWAGFNLEIGAIIAGISLGSSPYQRQIISRIKPLRDFFIVLFFIMLGTELQIKDAGSAILPGILISLFVLLVDPVILFFVMRKLKYTRRNAFLAGITSAQVSEFGFILIFKGQEIGWLQNNELAVLTFVALTTIVISSYLIEYNEQIYQKLIPFFNLFGKDKLQEEKLKQPVPSYEVWVLGYHRLGWKVCAALIQKKISFAVIDFSPEIINKLKKLNIPAYFGDAADVEFLSELPFEKAKIIISTLPEADDQLTLIRHIRGLSKKIYIIANLYHARYLSDFYKAGADYVTMPHLLGGNWIAEMIKTQPWNKRKFVNLRTQQKEEMKLRHRHGVH